MFLRLCEPPLDGGSLAINGGGGGQLVSGLFYLFLNFIQIQKNTFTFSCF